MLFSQLLEHQDPKHSILKGTTLQTKFKCGCISLIRYQDNQNKKSTSLSPISGNLQSDNTKCIEKHDDIDFTEFDKMRISSAMAIVTEILGFSSIETSLKGRKNVIK